MHRNVICPTLKQIEVNLEILSKMVKMSSYSLEINNIALIYYINSKLADKVDIIM